MDADLGYPRNFDTEFSQTWGWYHPKLWYINSVLDKAYWKRIGESRENHENVKIFNQIFRFHHFARMPRSTITLLSEKVEIPFLNHRLYKPLSIQVFHDPQLSGQINAATTTRSPRVHGALDSAEIIEHCAQLKDPDGFWGLKPSGNWFRESDLLFTRFQ